MNNFSLKLKGPPNFRNCWPNTVPFVFICPSESWWYSRGKSNKRWSNKMFAKTNRVRYERQTNNEEAPHQEGLERSEGKRCRERSRQCKCRHMFGGGRQSTLHKRSRRITGRFVDKTRRAAIQDICCPVAGGSKLHITLFLPLFSHLFLSLCGWR